MAAYLRVKYGIIIKYKNFEFVKISGALKFNNLGLVFVLIIVIVLLKSCNTHKICFYLVEL